MFWVTFLNRSIATPQFNLRGLLFAFACSWTMFTAGQATAEVIPGLDDSAIAGYVNQQEANQKLLPAIEAFRSGDMASFLPAYEAAMKELNNLPAAEIYRAKLLIEGGRMGDAIAGLDQYLIKSPDNPEGYLALGEIALRANRLTEASLLLDHAKKLCDEGKLSEFREPSVLPGLLSLLAEAAQRRQIWDQADDFYTQLIALDKSRHDFVWKRGRMLVIKGDVDQGVSIMAQARAANQTLPSPELAAALLLAEKQESGTAEKWFRAAVTADRNDPVRWSEYLKWLLSTGRSVEAKGMISKMTPELRKNRSILLFDGLAARYLDDFAKAEEIFSALHQSNPADLEAADQLAAVLVESKDEAKRGRALQLSESNMRQAPNLEATIATAAWVQFKLGSVDVADQLLSNLASKIAISPQTAYYISQVIMAKGNETDSRRLLELALKTPGLWAQRSKVKAELSSNP